MTESLQDRWDIEVEISEDVDNFRYSKKIILTIKNHSPYIRKFEVGTKYINFKDQYAALKFRMYYNLISPVVIPIDKYRKEKVEILIPKVNSSSEDNIIIYVKNLDKNEEKDIKIYV
ncbi:hypothetical protein YN1_2150 [Nanoarchaeota archaeon]